MKTLCPLNWRHNIQQNDTRRNATCYGTQLNDILQNGKEQNAIQRNATLEIRSQIKVMQQNDIYHNDIKLNGIQLMGIYQNDDQQIDTQLNIELDTL